ncbi:hypothetical protein BGZ67_004052 [Mortierella alpina]|nr:hypothetical protein BGZ67_004052 [Mortierella alpina]
MDTASRGIFLEKASARACRDPQRNHGPVNITLPEYEQQPNRTSKSSQPTSEELGTFVEEEIDWDNLSTQNLVGQTTVGGQTAPDLDHKTSHIWFAFSVLSIRTEGVFKLRFSLYDLTRMKENKAPALHQVFSDPIHVQSPKKFLGTCDNNEIANHLNKYSIRIPSRKDEKPYKS